MELSDVNTVSVLSGVLFAAVMILLLVGGIVLTARARRDRGRPAVLGMWGCAVLLVGVLFQLVQSFTLPALIDYVGIRSISSVIALEGLLQVIIEVIGTGLLIWAVIARNSTPGQPQGRQQPYDPAPGWQPGPPPQQPGGQNPGPPNWQNPQQPPR
jgi:hypothetical protein